MNARPEPFPNQRLNDAGELDFPGTDASPFGRPSTVDIQTAQPWVRRTAHSLRERTLTTAARACEGASVFYINAARRAKNVRQSADQVLARALTRGRYFADERPMHFIAAIAGITFVAGVLLRLRRQSRP
jgi:hypothetical protein